MKTLPSALKKIDFHNISNHFNYRIDNFSIVQIGAAVFLSFFDQTLLSIRHGERAYRRRERILKWKSVVRFTIHLIRSIGGKCPSKVSFKLM